MTELLAHLQRLRSEGRKLLVPYVMAGIPDAQSWPQALRAVASAGDAVEIGLPFSDPVMDGPVIAGAGQRVIRAGIGPLEALDLVSGIELDAPRLAMTYYNPIFVTGEAEFCRRAVKAGISGLIVPDLPLEEADGLRRAAADEGLGWVSLVAPSSPQERVAALAEAATGFLYAVSTLGVTGTRTSLAESAAKVVETCRAATDLPVLVGIGVSTPDQAREAARVADGVVIGSAVVRALLERGAEAAAAFLGEVRNALQV